MVLSEKIKIWVKKMNSSFQAFKQKKKASTESGYKYKKKMKMNSFLQKLEKKNRSR